MTLRLVHAESHPADAAGSLVGDPRLSAGAERGATALPEAVERAENRSVRPRVGGDGSPESEGLRKVWLGSQSGIELLQGALVVAA